MKSAILASCAAFLSTACMTDQTAYYDAQIKVAQANAASAQARTAALSKLAESDDPTAKVAAVFGMAFDQVMNRPTGVQQAPNEALQWAAILAGPLTTVAMGWQNMKVMENNSNNARDVALSTNQTMGNIAGMGIAGTANVANTGMTNMNSLGQAGVQGTVDLGALGFENMGTLGQAGIDGAKFGYDYVNPPVTIVPPVVVPAP